MFNLKPKWPEGVDHSSSPWDTESLNARYVKWCERHDPTREIQIRVVLGRDPSLPVPDDAGTWRESFRLIREFVDLGWVGWGQSIVRESTDSLAGARRSWSVSRACDKDMQTMPVLIGMALGSDPWTVRAEGLRQLQDHPNVLEMSLSVPLPSLDQGYERVSGLPEKDEVGMYEMFHWLAEKRANGAAPEEVFAVDVTGKGTGFRVGDEVRWVTLEYRRTKYEEWAAKPWEKLGLTEPMVRELTRKPSSRVALARGACPWDL